MASVKDIKSCSVRITKMLNLDLNEATGENRGPLYKNIMNVQTAIESIVSKTPLHVNLMKGKVKRKRPTNSAGNKLELESNLVGETPRSKNTPRLQPTSEQMERWKKPFEEGWRRELVSRNAMDKKKTIDVYYFAPDGKKLRSVVDIEKYFDVMTTKKTVTLDCFTFTKRAVHCEPYEVSRMAGDQAKRVQQNTKDKVNRPSQPGVSTQKEARRSQHTARPQLKKRVTRPGKTSALPSTSSSKTFVITVSDSPPSSPLPPKNVGQQSVAELESSTSSQDKTNVVAADSQSQFSVISVPDLPSNSPPPHNTEGEEPTMSKCQSSDKANGTQADSSDFRTSATAQDKRKGSEQSPSGSKSRSQDKTKRFVLKRPHLSAKWTRASSEQEAEDSQSSRPEPGKHRGTEGSMSVSQTNATAQSKPQGAEPSMCAALVSTPQSQSSIIIAGDSPPNTTSALHTNRDEVTMTDLQSGPTSQRKSKGVKKPTSKSSQREAKESQSSTPAQRKTWRGDRNMSGPHFTPPQHKPAEATESLSDSTSSTSAEHTPKRVKLHRHKSLRSSSQTEAEDSQPSTPLLGKAKGTGPNNPDSHTCTPESKCSVVSIADSLSDTPPSGKTKMLETKNKKDSQPSTRGENSSEEKSIDNRKVNENLSNRKSRRKRHQDCKSDDEPRNKSPHLQEHSMTPRGEVQGDHEGVEHGVSTSPKSKVKEQVSSSFTTYPENIIVVDAGVSESDEDCVMYEANEVKEESDDEDFVSCARIQCLLQRPTRSKAEAGMLLSLLPHVNFHPSSMQFPYSGNPGGAPSSFNYSSGATPSPYHSNPSYYNCNPMAAPYSASQYCGATQYSVRYAPAQTSGVHYSALTPLVGAPRPWGVQPPPTVTRHGFPVVQPIPVRYGRLLPEGYLVNPQRPLAAHRRSVPVPPSVQVDCRGSDFQPYPEAKGIAESARTRAYRRLPAPDSNSD